MSVVAERVTVNPVTEDSSLVPLDLVGLDRHWGIYLREHDYTPPALDTIHSSSADTEGDVVVQSRYLNRTITAKVRVFEPEDPASTNIATNPAGELATTGWAGVSLAAGPTRVVPSNVPPGLGIDTAIEAQTNAVADYLYHEVAVTNGKTYRFSVYVQLRAKVAALALQAVVYNAAGAVKKATGARRDALLAHLPRRHADDGRDQVAQGRHPAAHLGRGKAARLRPPHRPVHRCPADARHRP